VATNDFVMLPTRKRSVTRIGVFRARFEWPLARRSVPFLPWTSTTTPGTPAATSASICLWSEERHLHGYFEAIEEARGARQ